MWLNLESWDRQIILDYPDRPKCSAKGPFWERQRDILHRRVGSVTMKAESGVMAKEFQQVPEARRNKKQFFL